MSRARMCLGFLGGFAAVLLCSTTPAEEVTYTDGDFASWDMTSYFGPNADASILQHPGDGNPGGCVRVVLDLDDAAFRRAAYGLGRKDDFEWIPTVEGTITSLGMQIDATRDVGDEQNLKLLVYQDGEYYVAPEADSPTGSSNGAWSTLTWGPFSNNQFVRMDGPKHEEWNLTAHPDFAGGLPLKFGFAAGGEVEGGDQSWAILRYDNWRLTVGFLPIPEPSTLALVGMGGLVWLARVYRRRVRRPTR